MLYNHTIVFPAKPADSKSSSSRFRHSGPVLVPDEPKPRRRSPSPARNFVSSIVHVCDLVRPYTLGQLKALLSRTGTLVEGGFWIDKIKSHCFATVSFSLNIFYSSQDIIKDRAEWIAMFNLLHGEF